MEGREKGEIRAAGLETGKSSSNEREEAQKAVNQERRERCGDKERAQRKWACRDKDQLRHTVRDYRQEATFPRTTRPQSEWDHGEMSSRRTGSHVPQLV